MGNGERVTGDGRLDGNTPLKSPLDRGERTLTLIWRFPLKGGKRWRRRAMPDTEDGELSFA
jgi:hypothetical protein